VAPLKYFPVTKKPPVHPWVQRYKFQDLQSYKYVYTFFAKLVVWCHGDVLTLFTNLRSINLQPIYFGAPSEFMRYRNKILCSYKSQLKITEAVTRRLKVTIYYDHRSRAVEYLYGYT